MSCREWRNPVACTLDGCNRGGCQRLWICWQTVHCRRASHRPERRTKLPHLPVNVASRPAAPSGLPCSMLPTVQLNTVQLQPGKRRQRTVISCPVAQVSSAAMHYPGRCAILANIPTLCSHSATGSELLVVSAALFPWKLPVAEPRAAAIRYIVHTLSTQQCFVSLRQFIPLRIDMEDFDYDEAPPEKCVLVV